MAVSERQQVEVGEVVLRYDELGTGDPPLLLLHGFTGAAVDFVDVAPDLARDRRVVMYDQRGHGDSTNTGDASTYTFDQLTADLAGFVAARGARAIRPPRPLDGRDHLDAIRVGASGARAFARVDGHRSPPDGAARDVFGGLTKMGREQGMDAVFAVIRQFWVQQAEAAGQPAPEVMLERGRTEVLDMDPEAFATFADALGEYPSMVERLGEITCPTTVIVGANDTGLRASADVMAECIAGAELIVIPDAGHSPQEDQPAAWVAAVRHHLTRV